MASRECTVRTLILFAIVRENVNTARVACNKRNIAVLKARKAWQAVRDNIAINACCPLCSSVGRELCPQEPTSFFCDRTSSSFESFIFLHRLWRSSHLALNQLLSVRANHTVQDAANLAASIKTDGNHRFQPSHVHFCLENQAADSVITSTARNCQEG
jgi:hypothetical protein